MGDDDVDAAGGGCGCGCLLFLYIPGMVLATIISWETHRSLLWAVIHCWLGWFYIGYLFVHHLL